MLPNTSTVFPETLAARARLRKITSPPSSSLLDAYDETRESGASVTGRARGTLPHGRARRSSVVSRRTRAVETTPPRTVVHTTLYTVVTRQVASQYPAPAGTRMSDRTVSLRRNHEPIDTLAVPHSPRESHPCDCVLIDIAPLPPNFHYHVRSSCALTSERCDGDVAVHDARRLRARAGAEGHVV